MAIKIAYSLEVSFNLYQDDNTDYIRTMFIDEYNLNYDLNVIGGVEHSEIENNLLEFSKLNPEHLFTLYGNEIDNEVQWVKYFQNGLCQYEEAIIVYPKFDVNKLK